MNKIRKEIDDKYVTYLHHQNTPWNRRETMHNTVIQFW